MAVWKSGRTTGITAGIVEAIGVETLIQTPIGRRRFLSQSIIRPRAGSVPTAPGDSGSVWLKDGPAQFANYAAVHHSSSDCTS
ncbi:hypothetical protein [Paenibacillus glacialis]|uniref:hypothetical protein n=1 Tax=Paenibacillus glacialis TaxID=494026 RepID=UPI0013735B49|nr:hypothetical protein [Paenibacillus glacialis]